MPRHHCHTHNLVDPSEVATEKPWGIRVSAPATDPFNRLVGADWSRTHWFADVASRDAAYEKMRKKHGFYRIGDEPSQILVKIDPDSTN